MSNLDQLLRNRPKLLKGSQTLIQPKSTQEFSLNLDKAMFTMQQAPRLIRPTDFDVQPKKQYEVHIDSVDINEQQFEKLIPKKSTKDPIIEKEFSDDEDKVPMYVNEQEKTKKFLMEVLSEELARLDSNTGTMLQKLEEDQKKMQTLTLTNNEISEEVRLMVQNKRLENRIAQLEDELNVPKELKLNLINADWNVANEKIEQMLKENQDLYNEADKIASEYAKQQLEVEQQNQYIL